MLHRHYSSKVASDVNEEVSSFASKKGKHEPRITRMTRIKTRTNQIRVIRVIRGSRFYRESLPIPLSNFCLAGQFSVR